MYYPEAMRSVALDTPELVEYLQRELSRVSAALQLVEQGQFLPVLSTEPSKLREGMLAIADGVNWNPGSGKGLYEYRSGAWAKL